MTVDEMFEDVKATVARGDVLDSVIPSRIGWAIRKLERNKSYRYMVMFGQTDLPAGAVRINLPFPRDVKSIRWVRVVGASGRYAYLGRKGDERRNHGFVHEAHGFDYTLTGDYIRLNQPFADRATIDVSWRQYSPLKLPGNSEPTLLREAPDLVHAETIIQLAPRIRNPKMIAEYKGIRDEALRTSMIAEDEAEHADRKYRLGPAWTRPQQDEAVEYPLVPLGSELHQPSAEQVEASTDAWASFGLYVLGGGNPPPTEEIWEIK